jgi:hypothetical protein
MFMMKPLATVWVVTNSPRARITVLFTGAGETTTNGCAWTTAGLVVTMVLLASRSTSMFRRTDWPAVITRGWAGSNVKGTLTAEIAASAGPVTVANNAAPLTLSHTAGTE